MLGMEPAPARDPGCNLQTQEEMREPPGTLPRGLLPSTATPWGTTW